MACKARPLTRHGASASCKRRPMLFCTFTLIVAPSIVFLAVIGPTRSVLENLIYAALFVITLVSYVPAAQVPRTAAVRTARGTSQPGCAGVTATGSR